MSQYKTEEIRGYYVYAHVSVLEKLKLLSQEDLAVELDRMFENGIITELKSGEEE